VTIQGRMVLTFLFSGHTLAQKVNLFCNGGQDLNFSKNGFSEAGQTYGVGLE
jgi:hypothetical protein